QSARNPIPPDSSPNQQEVAPAKSASEKYIGRLSGERRRAPVESSIVHARDGAPPNRSSQDVVQWERHQPALPLLRGTPTRRQKRSSEEPGPTVQVTIGRVEIRAISPITDKPTVPVRPKSPKAGMSLADYLRRRSSERS